MNAMDNKKGLGRGLASLLGDTNDVPAPTGGNAPRAAQTIPVGQIYPSPFQPRRDFDPMALQELADSIKQRGLLQPILVRRDAQNAGRYQLIAGERRWRAAQLAKLHDIPAIIKDISDTEAAEIALIENIQRQDLSALEEAMAYARLMDEFRYTQDQIAKGLGKSRSHVANLVRLLDLPKFVREQLQSGALSASHARLLIGVGDAAALAQAMIERQLNVRQAQELVETAQRAAAAAEKAATPGAARIIGLSERAKFTPVTGQKPANANPATTKPGDDGPDADTRDLAKQLSQALGMRVDIAFQGKAGQLTIHYANLDQLDDVLRRLRK